MNITCPACATLQTVILPAQDTPQHMLQCQHCNHLWALTLAGNTPWPDKGGTLADNDPTRSENLPSHVEKVGLWSVTSSSVRNAWSRTGDLETGHRDPNRRWIHLRAFAAMVAIILGIASVLHFKHTSIISIFPSAIPAYAAIGYPVNIRGMDFHHVTFSWDKIDETTFLTIEGQISNISERARPIPRIGFSLYDAEGVEIYHWTDHIDQESLEPGQYARFLTQVSPPLNGKTVRIRFLD